MHPLNVQDSPQSEASAYPLQWPANWPRSKSPHSSRFGNHTVHQSLDELKTQLEKLGGTNLVVSSNFTLNSQSPKDPGVAVYFNLRKLRCALACDRWSTLSHNIWAIAKHIEALRGQDRWGVGSIDQAFAGYAALNAPSGKDPWTLLGIKREGATREKIMDAYRRLSLERHPDRGGSTEAFQELTAAKDLAISNLP